MEAEDAPMVDDPEAKLEPVALPAFVGLFTGIITALILGKYPGIVSWIYSGYMEEVFTLQIILIFTIPAGYLLSVFQSKKYNLNQIEMFSGMLVFIIFGCMASFAMGCGFLLIILLWLWASLYWWRYNLPSFRLGVWYSMGLCSSAMLGNLMMYWY